MSLRQLARQLKAPGTLAQFWQGSSVLAPQLQEQQRQVQAGQQWQCLENGRQGVFPSPFFGFALVRSFRVGLYTAGTDLYVIDPSATCKERLKFALVQAPPGFACLLITEAGGAGQPICGCQAASGRPALRVDELHGRHWHGARSSLTWLFL